MNHFTAVNHHPDAPGCTFNVDRNYHEEFDISLNFIEKFIQIFAYKYHQIFVSQTPIILSFGKFCLKIEA